MPQSPVPPPISITINKSSDSPVDLSVKNHALRNTRNSTDHTGPINKFITLVGSPPPPSGKLRIYSITEF